MQFAFQQSITVGVDQVISTLSDEAYYASIGDLGPLGSPSLLSVDRSLTTTVSVRWKFQADLPGPARAALDPERLTWVIQTSFADQGKAKFLVLPDHYADMLSCSGSLNFSEVPEGCLQLVTGELKVRFPLFGGKVERVIAQGLETHIAEEAKAIAAFADRAQ